MRRRSSALRGSSRIIECAARPVGPSADPPYGLAARQARPQVARLRHLRTSASNDASL